MNSRWRRWQMEMNFAVGVERRASFSQSADSPQNVLTTKWRGGNE
ncbi:hypothetical protein PLANPX_2646 [Lacipirellula parvula]|uniref:Uncharacterized protein n=1 Tax=Lacipirellula parvula TaxID=2650471 RepID=A0A5K7X8A8_9BACT|nr:hypothetical protein PLANPX_2646 [Lacipirellula parvula]